MIPIIQAEETEAAALAAGLGSGAMGEDDQDRIRRKLRSQARALEPKATTPPKMSKAARVARDWQLKQSGIQVRYFNPDGSQAK